MIEEALCETFGGTADECPAATTASTANFLRALGAAGGQDIDTVALIEHVIAIDMKLVDLKKEIAKLIAKRPRDRAFLAQCEDALKVRADLAALKKRELLDQWDIPLAQTLWTN
jgi:hypothetical protein